MGSVTAHAARPQLSPEAHLGLGVTSANPGHHIGSSSRTVAVRHTRLCDQGRGAEDLEGIGCPTTVQPNVVRKSPRTFGVGVKSSGQSVVVLPSLGDSM